MLVFIGFGDISLANPVQGHVSVNLSQGSHLESPVARNSHGDGQVPPQGHFTGIKSGGTGPEGCVDVAVPKDQAGKVWSVVLFAGGNLCLKMEGIPTYVSASAGGWFDPKRP